MGKPAWSGLDCLVLTSSSSIQGGFGGAYLFSGDVNNPATDTLANVLTLSKSKRERFERTQTRTPSKRPRLDSSSSLGSIEVWQSSSLDEVGLTAFQESVELSNSVPTHVTLSIARLTKRLDEVTLANKALQDENKLLAKNVDKLDAFVNQATIKIDNVNRLVQRLQTAVNQHDTDLNHLEKIAGSNSVQSGSGTRQSGDGAVGTGPHFCKSAVDIPDRSIQDDVADIELSVDHLERQMKRLIPDVSALVETTADGFQAISTMLSATDMTAQSKSTCATTLTNLADSVPEMDYDELTELDYNAKPEELGPIGRLL
jgi:cell division septum initiation protein DivIVA